MKYVVGYDRKGEFVVLHECNNVRIALLMVKKINAQGKVEAKIKKRA